MTQKLFTLIISLFATIGIANAQDTIMLMRGKRLLVSDSKVEITAKGDTEVSYQLPNGKRKSKSIDKVFSLTNKDGEQVFYIPDTLNGVPLTIEQMRYFLNGHADFRGPGFCWWAFLLGIESFTEGALIPPVEFGDRSSGSVNVGMLVPCVYLGVVSRTTRSARKIKSKNPDIPDNEYYIEGAQYAIAQEHLRSGAYGVLAGLIQWIIISPFIDSGD